MMDFHTRLQIFVVRSLVIRGKASIADILVTAHVEGNIWVATDSGADSDGAVVNEGDGLVSVGGKWVAIGRITGPCR